MAPSASDQEPSREQRIWQVVCLIPAGRVAAYGQVAELAGLPGLARFVGRALGRLPDGHQVPWYRVLKSDGRIAMPAGSEGHENQSRLLREEGVEVTDGRVAMSRYRWRP
ncbi:MAG: MGMT family protein [Marinobacter sp.]|uniref:MGMT family protein n=1 Tax=Marinobacter sp. TaxID=50741 RepID=UPI00299D8623|nr:MGMT family protein [Marinobacter sp.]MDX1633641.1 MGMT family protein [Marinobacter sp.]